MKTKTTTLLLVAALFTGMLLFNQNNTAAQEIISGNLFQNPGWEEGYFNQDGIPQIAVPNGWRMHWIDGVAFEGTEGRPAYRPETVVWNIADAPENERDLFFRDGSYTLKIFKSWAPMYAAISQDVKGLEVGRKYRIVAPIFVDVVEKYEGGQKVAPYNDPGFVRFGAGKLGAPWRDASQINYSPYWSAANVNPFYLTMNIYIWDFVATEPDMTIFIEMGSRYPWPNNGFFLDGVGLFALDQREGGVSSGGSGGGGGNAAAPAGTPLPTSTPAPTPTPRADGSIVHVVGAGDTFWSIAIEYAPALGLTAEEALPVIMELNDNPAFISAGQELLIKEPDPNAAANAAAAESADATPTDAAATPEGETAEGEGDAIVVEGEEPAEAAATAVPETSDAPAEEAAAESTSGGVCLQVYEDINGNELYDSDEPLFPDAAVTLFRAGTTVTTYITDGVSEPHCIDNLEGGAYEIQVFPPANYRATTPDTWAVAITEGVMVPVAFGVQEGAAEVAMVGTPDAGAAAEGDTAAATPDAETAAEEANASSDSGGIMANIGLVVLGIAVVLVLLAGAGVILLRRA
ncbi:MAG TPA: LysM peptidoglycan-binding domain-containing protein [Anaerolineae bacterium]|nr:LysM peptidoglycan-binding domain-containing protein [Anaerolineae bacterium]